jgi:CheY-like chemotaxis protein
MAAPLVLVVDDDPDILEAIGDILESEGYRVARARDGAEALDRVAAEPPSLILLDLMMPVLDGIGFARSLRALGLAAGVPIVVVSADAHPARAVAVGAQGYLAKPFDVERLLGEVGRLSPLQAPG